MDTLRERTVFIKILLVILVSLWGGSCWGEAAQAATEGAYQLSEIVFQKTGDDLSMEIKGNTPPTFTVYELFDPLRVVIDIANASFAGSMKLPIEVNQSPVSSVAGKILQEKEPYIAKLEIFLTEDREYNIERSGNDILLSFEEMKESGMAAAEKPAAGIEVHRIKISADGDTIKALLLTDKPVTDFSQMELARDASHPDRIYIDIPGATAAGLAKVQEVDQGALARIRTAQRDDGIRVVFDSNLDKLFQYEVATAPEGLLVAIKAFGQDSMGGAESRAAAEHPDPVKDRLASHMAAAGKEKSSYEKSAAGGNQTKFGKEKDLFAQAGYDRQRTSWDFYKINLHNVFRLIGEISGYNMVIEEAVRGTLTLSLDNVPWDFVLDLILNLEGLQKEERYNTIVISPKSKSFVWPEKRSEEEIELQETSDKILVVVDEQQAQPPGVAAAESLMASGNALVKEGKNREALARYEEAVERWQDAGLAKRIAKICLTDLEYYQAAVNFAEKALGLNPDDPEAALLAAVGNANMRKPAAKKYFEMATRGQRPNRSALLSYAVYGEETSDLEGAMAVLARHDELYGDSLSAMIAKARIYDKMEQSDKAVAEYKAILLSGYELESDLIQYINGRIALDKQQ